MAPGSGGRLAGGQEGGAQGPAGGLGAHLRALSVTQLCCLFPGWFTEGS